MASTGFPEIILTCSNGHTFPSSASPGRTIRCHTCGKNTRMPSGRPRNARELSEWNRKQTPETGSDPFSATWDNEPPFDQRIRYVSRISGHCASCSNKTSEATPRGTFVYCPNCNTRVDELRTAVRINAIIERINKHAHDAKRTRKAAADARLNTEPLSLDEHVTIGGYCETLVDGIQGTIARLNPNDAPGPYAAARASEIRGRLRAIEQRIKTIRNNPARNSLDILNKITATLRSEMESAESIATQFDNARNYRAQQKQAITAPAPALAPLAIEPPRANEPSKPSMRGTICALPHFIGPLAKFILYLGSYPSPGFASVASKEIPLCGKCAKNPENIAQLKNTYGYNYAGMVPIK